MMKWTESARRTLEQYCARSRVVLAGSGADAEEVADDLRRHVEEEAREDGLTVVTEEQVRRILSRVGELEPGAELEAERSDPANATRPAAKESDEQRGAGGLAQACCLLFGVLLPSGVLLFEMLTGMSSGVLLDPLPTWFHVVAVALVPAANLWIWEAARRRDARHVEVLGWLNGAAFGVCLYYGILYLLFVPIAVIGILYLGLGFIPLSPYFAMLATPALRSHYARRIGSEGLPGGVKGAILILIILALFQVPTALTYYGLGKAASDEPAERERGIRVLRAIGDDELMLRAAYGLLRRELDMDMVRWIAGGDSVVQAEEARGIYYRVTGKPFNSVPPPALFTRTGRWTLLEEEFTWDEALGGEKVAGLVKGLSLFSSRMDAVAEPEAAVTYCEWTLEFKNVASQAREARAQIALPPGGVVSRLTLWINGEEREAAFGGRSQVREAYQEVAVVQRRDPVLVTTCGPDRVLMQCFPVPPGGMMKVRLGITAPLILDSLEQGRFFWPRFLERNFKSEPGLQHALWIQSGGGLSAKDGSITAREGRFTFHDALTEEGLTEAVRSIRVERPAHVTDVWTPAETGGLIQQTIRSVSARMPERLVLVLDGSAGMARFVPELTEVLSALPETMELAVLVASDVRSQLNVRPQKITPAVLDEARSAIRHSRFVGGQDNLPVLETAWDLAAEVENGAVLWIHLPGPALLSAEGGLRQRIERTDASARLFELQLQNGPDRLVEKLDGLPAVIHVPYTGSVQSDVKQLLARWSGLVPSFEIVRERNTALEQGGIGPRVSRHIERLWARDETLRLTIQRLRDAATKLAAQHQLVTPITGAVVLETQEQFARHGLTPVDAMTVPAIPEPNAVSLMVIGLGMWWLRRRKAARS